MSAVSRLTVLKDVASFVLGWGLLGQQAWLSQHGGQVSEWLVTIAALIIGVPGIQHALALRTGAPSAPSSSSQPPSSSLP